MNLPTKGGSCTPVILPYASLTKHYISYFSPDQRWMPSLPMISKSSQKLGSRVQLVQLIWTGTWSPSLPLSRNTTSWIVLSVHVINNLGVENEDFLNAKIKGMILSSVDEGAPFWSDESCGPAVIPPARILWNLIELRGTHKPPSVKLNFHLGSFDFQKLHQQQNHIDGGHWFYGASNR